MAKVKPVSEIKARCLIRGLTFATALLHRDGFSPCGWGKRLWLSNDPGRRQFFGVAKNEYPRTSSCTPFVHQLVISIPQVPPKDENEVSRGILLVSCPNNSKATEFLGREDF